MVRQICKDVLFLNRKAEPATKADMPIVIDLLDTLKANEKFFGDFYSLASGELYSELTVGYTKRVEIRDKWSEIDIINLPYNTDYVAEF